MTRTLSETIFEIVSMEKCFPLIEGQVESGIYRLSQGIWDYYEIKDAFALSRIFDEIVDFDFNCELEKFVCRSAGISLCEIKTGSEINFYERHLKIEKSFDIEKYLALSRRQKNWASLILASYIGISRAFDTAGEFIATD